MKKISVILLFLILFVFPQKILAANLLDIIISEICWMGTDVSANDEWIELYNNTEQDINLEGWGIYEASGEILIEPLTGTIYAHSFYLVERTDDTTVPDIPASQEPSGWSGSGLKNSGEYLKILDNNSNVIDEINCLEGWFSGDNATKQTMEKIDSQKSGNDSSNWQTGGNPGGTPKIKNSEIIIKNISGIESVSNPEPTQTSSLSETDDLQERSEEPAPLQTENKVEERPLPYSENIVLNEILPSPEGPDSENEWIVPTIQPKTLGCL